MVKKKTKQIVYNWKKYGDSDNIHTRTMFLVDTLGPNQNSFAVKTGNAPMMVYYVSGKGKRKSIPNFHFIYKVLNAFPEVSLRWYILGNGMWNGSDDSNSRLRDELDKYKKLYSDERLINNALRKRK